MRLMFMREGKEAGALWPASEDSMPTPVRTQLLALIEATGAAFSALAEDDRDALMTTFMASARKSRRFEAASSVERAAATSSALRERVTTALEASNAAAARRDDEWAHPTPHALDVVRKVSAAPSDGISMEDLTTLFREVGRLSAPLWVSGEWDHLPEAMLQAGSALWAVLAPILRPEQRFNEATWEFETPSSDEVIAALQDAKFETLRRERVAYFSAHPIIPLPENLVLRRQEEERRAELRVTASVRAASAIDHILLPLTGPVSEYERMEAEAAEAREREALARQLAARVAAGFRRPDPQLYGVSQRGSRAWVADALRWLGEHDAEIADESTGLGADIMSSRLAVLVQHSSGSVDAPAIHEIYGVATALNRSAAVWTSGSLTADAAKFADLVSVAVVRYDVENSTWAGLNDSGVDFVSAFDV